ncbi:cytosol aminopeptidase-like [Adelges cooleyi]|uniref:cytosol aminopeptidase-like n=1 Tax=Adelges cooleyi TaxID=133065 RepID=UPI00218046F4|nr:cytosol aminopeptidase-like [Adelges cooleyi]
MYVGMVLVAEFTKEEEEDSCYSKKSVQYKRKLQGLSKRVLLHKWKIPSVWPRLYAESLSCSPTGVSPSQKGLVLGCYVRHGDRTGETLTLTKTASKFNDIVKGKLLEQLKAAKPPPAKCEVRTFFGLDTEFPYVSVVGLDDGCLGYNEREGINDEMECVRNAAALGTKSLLNFDLQKIYLESFESAQNSAEGASMGMWSYDELKSRENKKALPKIELYDSCDWYEWQIGLQKGAAQNLTRQLQDIPANLLTPKSFARQAVTLLSNQGIDVIVRAKRFMESRKMNGLLAVSSGSCEEPQLLECTYEGCDMNAPPIVLIAPGLTYNSGGLGSLRTCSLQKYVRGEVSGAACLISVLRAVSALELKLNIKAFIPLSENIIGSGAMEPGAVVDMKKLTVLVKDTAKANQLIVADVLTMIASDSCYKPHMLLDLGPYSDRTEVWTTQAVGAFTSNDSLMESLRAAAMKTGDRVWRLPLWKQASVQMTSAAQEVDVVNSMPIFGGFAMQAAAFLQQFVPLAVPWLHLEIGGLLRTNGLDAAYLAPGMSGRPTRTLIELLGQMTCPQPTK